ncbi:MAG: hypothetical protein ABSG44_18545 [Thermodesulfobacteriota bacterium]|jgi:phage shock protein A
MKNKPIKRTNLKLDTIAALHQKNQKLQVQVDRLKHKILELETKILKQKQKIIKVEIENSKLREEKAGVDVKIVKFGNHNKASELTTNGQGGDQ